MNDFPKRQLLINYLLGLCTQDEEKEVEHWLDKEPGNVALLQEVAKEIGHKGSLSFTEKGDVKNQIFDKIRESKSEDSNRGDNPIAHTSTRSYGFIRSGLWFKVAAMIFIIVTAGLIGFYYNNSAPSEVTDQIELRQRSLSNGQTATLRFGDGSVITLNAGSTLRYPEKFSKDKREVYLQGEAFFSVPPDTSRPFIVHAGNTKTSVLGTSFNIRAYKNEDDLQVAVADGKVAVSQNGEEQEGDQPKTVLLNENQWITYRSSGQLVEKGEGNISELVAWKDKKMIFTDKPLDQIATRLERWYNIDIVLADSSLGNRRMSASFEEETMTEVLTIIALSLDMSYKKEGREVTFHEEK